MASVIGRDVDLGLLAGASGSEVLDCLEALEPAVLQRLVVHLDERPGTYRFVHALVREVIADGLSPMQLAVEHLRVADAIAEGDDTAEIVAEHLWAATPLGVGPRAAAKLEHAARVAISRTAYHAAEHLLERAVELHRSAADPDAELHALASIAAVLAAHRGDAVLNDSPIVARARQIGVRTADNVDRLMLLWAEWEGRLATGQLDLAEPLAGELLTLAEVSAHPLVRAMGHGAYGGTCWHRGRLAEAAAHLEISSTASVEAQGFVENRLFYVAELRMARPFLVLVRDLMGDFPDPAASHDAVRRELPGDPLWSLMASSNAMQAALVVGDVERAVHEAQTGIAADPGDLLDG